MVIQELNPELLVPVTLFYLILRGLDTIEDDMTIPLEKKEPILRDFHNIMFKEGWQYHDNGPNEKDAPLLKEFNVVIEEFKHIKPEYQKIIIEITERMGNGMADTARALATEQLSVETVKDYEQYCHHVAGIVGEGCTRLFVEAGLANPALLRRADLHESMGQFLQQTNIIRDIREDTDDKRRFWPKAIWGKYVTNYDDLIKPENREAALRCSSDMILNALQKAPDCMFYMAGLKDQSVFNFCAIPQAMAIATLELCFRNPALFERNIKITKGQACQIMQESTQNLQVVYEQFRKFARRIHKKNDPMDPNFLKISVACGKVCQQLLL
jgi:farnesyl-diphosphate farnesyltransferase